MRAKSSGVSLCALVNSFNRSTMRWARYGFGYSSPIIGAPSAPDGLLLAVAMKCVGGS
jgi:hypothetical protein